MVAHVTTVAYLGLEARSVDVQVQIAKGGVNAFNVVGLPDKAGMLEVHGVGLTKFESIERSKIRLIVSKWEVATALRVRDIKVQSIQIDPRAFSAPLLERALRQPSPPRLDC